MCLLQIHILKFTKQKNYQQFLPIIEVYIETSFCAPLVHKELLSQMQRVLESQDHKDEELISNVIDVLDLLFKFIVRSAMLLAEYVVYCWFMLSCVQFTWRFYFSNLCCQVTILYKYYLLIPRSNVTASESIKKISILSSFWKLLIAQVLVVAYSWYFARR